MKNFDLKKLLRPHILELKPYSSARDEFSGSEGIFLDANENPYHSVNKEHYNRYPDPYQWKVKEKISVIKNVPNENIFLGNGSDEPIDLIIRAFCRPSIDNIIIMPPTYGMYEVSGSINDVEIRKVNLSSSFQIQKDAVLEEIDKNTKLLFICSPNNPSGNLLDQEDIIFLLENFDGAVVLDEAYIDFCPEATLLSRLKEFPNLIILQTFSKAWGMAALRLGMAFASEEIVKVLNKIKPPYNINALTQEKALEMLKHEDEKNKIVKDLLSQKESLSAALEKLTLVDKVYPSDANFVLVKVNKNAKEVYEVLVKKGIVVRDRSKVVLCEGCLRISIGTQEENDELIRKMGEI